ncbi:GDYXXLXY domain-containing protein, partial [Candidatus Gracilibacteria bacterium]|nr:GDYXXLXY domain-containing protein [Candidatus Gracilibacteria bacterium]
MNEASRSRLAGFDPDALIGTLPSALRFFLAFLVLAGLLAALFLPRAQILSSGREVRLAIVPVDPRDLLRGDYVILNYAIGELNLTVLPGDDGFRRGDPAFVVL